ncbi:MAG: DUF3349 domain-containing protein [Anaerolineae bacterium]|nr:DUF3349 domain-containing protein [Anaerolineae bacterium]
MENDTPDYLVSTYRMLKCAFPDKVSTDDYIALMAILHSEMSFRNIADVLSAITQKSYGEVYNDVCGFQPSDVAHQVDIKSVKKRLISCGFEAWLQED